MIEIEPEVDLIYDLLADMGVPIGDLLNNALIAASDALHKERCKS